MNTSRALPIENQIPTRARSVVSELALEEPAGKPDIPPYFSWPTRWPVSTARLWGSYLKSLLGGARSTSLDADSPGALER